MTFLVGMIEHRMSSLITALRPKKESVWCGFRLSPVVRKMFLSLLLIPLPFLNPFTLFLVALLGLPDLFINSFLFCPIFFLILDISVMFSSIPSMSALCLSLGWILQTSNLLVIGYAVCGFCKGLTRSLQYFVGRLCNPKKQVLVYDSARTW